LIALKTHARMAVRVWIWEKQQFASVAPGLLEIFAKDVSINLHFSHFQRSMAAIKIHVYKPLWGLRHVAVDMMGQELRLGLGFSPKQS